LPFFLVETLSFFLLSKQLINFAKMISKKQNSANKTKAVKKTAAIVSSSVGNYEKHPFFVKKAAAAKELLQRVGLPKQLQKGHA
jgi:hypothetical protein